MKEPSKNELVATKERVQQRTKGKLDWYLTNKLLLKEYKNTPLR